jgi:hypothetical protein
VQSTGENLAQFSFKGNCAEHRGIFDTIFIQRKLQSTGENLAQFSKETVQRTGENLTKF